MKACDAIAVVLLLVGSSWACADPVTAEEAVPEFAALDSESAKNFGQLELEDASAEVKPQLINGVPVDPVLFPGVLRMTSGGTCTASLIGPATILLAAHCVEHGQKIALEAGELEVRGICQQAPGYNTRTHEQDWALCLLERKVKNVVFERVGLNSIPTVGEELALTGYGCTFRGGPLDGKLRLGRAKVADRPTVLPKERAAIYTAAVLAERDAVICPGDSGGPLFRTGDDLAGPRTIVGVNSRTTYSMGVSIFSAIGSTEGTAFVTDFAQRFNQKICGHNLEVGCKAG